jgi:hypothetical protein
VKKSASAARLEQKVKSLSTLVAVNALISSTLNLDQILENTMAISKPVLRTGTGPQPIYLFFLIAQFKGV